jgi:hypothetical protein
MIEAITDLFAGAFWLGLIVAAYVLVKRAICKWRRR